MSSGLISTCMAAVTLAGMALASPVDTSLRPKARPDGSAEVVAVEDTQATVYAGLARSLRPMARPGNLRTEDVAQVTTANPAFDRWVRGFRGRAVAQGISARTFDAAFRASLFSLNLLLLV